MNSGTRKMSVGRKLELMDALQAELREALAADDGEWIRNVWNRIDDLRDAWEAL